MTPILEEQSTGIGQEVACNDYRLLIIGCCAFPANRRITVSHRTSLPRAGLAEFDGQKAGLAAAGVRKTVREFGVQGSAGRWFNDFLMEVVMRVLFYFILIYELLNIEKKLNRRDGEK